MRLPELTSRIREALLDRHAQVNQVESLAAARKVAASRDRRLEGRTHEELAKAAKVVRRGAEDAGEGAARGEADANDAGEAASQTESNRPNDERRGRFIDVEV